MSPPRILFLDQSGALGGGELYLLDVARAYADTSHVVLFEDGPFLERLRAEGVSAEVMEVGQSVHAVRKEAGPRALLSALPGLTQAVRRLAHRARDYDLIFANTQKTLFMGGLAGWWSARPVVWNLHDLLSPEHFTATTRRLAVWGANRFASHVIANSQATQRTFTDAGGRLPTSVVYNGIAPAPFRAVGPAEGAHQREQLGLGAAPVVGVFSRLAPWKGQHVLLDAVATLPDVHILLVGDALFDGDDAYAAALRRQAEEQGLSDRVHFLGFREDVPTLMRTCDVVAHTSVSPEPFGRVIVEGMLAERPVVATRAGGALEIIDHGATGWLVPPGEASALATTLRDLLAAPDRTRSVAAAGRRAAEARFSPTQMLLGIDRVLQKICPASSPPPLPDSVCSSDHVCKQT